MAIPKKILLDPMVGFQKPQCPPTIEVLIRILWEERNEYQLLSFLTQKNKNNIDTVK
jgi:hypothetical protein